MENTKKCPICGKPYKTFSHTAADQSACPKCVREAEKNIDALLSDSYTDMGLDVDYCMDNDVGYK